ncbi:MAG TPA: phosphoadenylyl-sulfate reductase [Acidimicrobiales bacterium]|nr:phosphoadenylyl-sulfate reductase [Acidimicrobiales bacterium]
MAGISAELESAPPPEVIEWAIRRFGRGLTIACSFQNCVIIDMATNIDPDVEVLFLDTGSHFAETLAYVEKVRCHYELNLKVQMPPPEADGVPCGAEGCCQLRKVRPLDAGLAGQRAWMSGLKRVDTAHRADAPVVLWDPRRRLVKINPLATWTDADVDRYIADRALPVHPLIERGYLSIGCAPATRPVLLGGDRRAGRWSGETKTECGLHL